MIFFIEDFAGVHVQAQEPNPGRLRTLRSLAFQQRVFLPASFETDPLRYSNRPAPAAA